MLKGILGPWGAATLMTTAVLLWAPALVAGQVPSREEIREAARAASPRTGEEAAEYFEAEFERRMAETIKRVYDPTTPPAANPPRTPWGDPDLRGYYLTANYTPLERPEGVTKALYTPQEAIEAFMHSATSDASVDDIRNFARSQGMTTLREAGLKLIFDGVTTIDEVVRETVLEDVI